MSGIDEWDPERWVRNAEAERDEAQKEARRLRFVLACIVAEHGTITVDARTIEGLESGLEVVLIEDHEGLSKGGFRLELRRRER